MYHLTNIITGMVITINLIGWPPGSREVSVPKPHGTATVQGAAVFSQTHMNLRQVLECGSPLPLLIHASATNDSHLLTQAATNLC